MRIAGTILLLLVLYGAGGQEIAVKSVPVAFTNPLKTSLDKKVDSLARPLIGQGKPVGMVIGVLDNGKTAVYGYGEKHKGQSQVPDGNTLFEIGSLSKIYTATLLSFCVQQGLMKLDDPVDQYLPDSCRTLVWNGKPITLKMLSNHSSGLPRMPLDAFAGASMENPYQYYDSLKLYTFLKKFKPYREPGVKYDYSNLAVGLLGVLLERITGKSYEQLLQEVITGPLGMKHTRINLLQNDSAGIAQGHDAKGAATHSWEFQAMAAAGAIRSTVTDMLRFMQAQMGTPASEAWQQVVALTRQQTFAEGSHRVALGWLLFKIGDREVLAHEGQTGGFASVMIIHPATRRGVVALSNSFGTVGSVAIELLNWLDKNNK